MIPFLEAPIAVLVLAFFGVVLATIQDLKTREVPDSLSGGLIALGFSLAIIRWSFGDGWGVVVNSALGFGFGYGVGALLYYMRQWGGGDAKLLAGLGALFGFFSSPSLIGVGFSMMGVWIAVGVVLVSGALAYLTRHEGRSSVLGTLAGGILVAAISLSIGSLSFGLVNLFLPGYLLLIFICGAVWGVLVLMYLAYRNREVLTISGFERVSIYAGLLFGVGVVSAVVFLSLPLSGLLFVLAALVAVSPLVLLVSRKLEGVLFTRSVDPTQLVLGDWLAEDVVVDATVVIAKSNPGLSSLQIDELTDLWDRKVISRIVIKDGIAFVPAFLFAFVIVLL